jgi:hypothetical protein
MKPKLSGYFFKHPREMYESAAFQVLNINERRCLDCLEHKVITRRGHNTDLVITRRMFEMYGVAHRHVTPSMNVIQKLGFVKCTERGRGGYGNYRRPNKWQLTYAETAPKRNDASHEWMRVTTREEAQAIAYKYRPHDKRKRRPPHRRKAQLHVIAAGELPP